MESSPQAAELPPPPVHVAIIMDGNGRWARSRGLPRTAGHKRGAESVRRTVEAAREMGVSYLTLYGFSSENWKRPASEIADLMGLLRLYLRNEIANLHKNGIRLKVIGERSRLGPDIVRLIEEAESRTESNVALTLVLALSYGGRQEIVEAMRSVARSVASGELSPDIVDETVVGSHLFTSGIPDPDLIIRTSGEKRISNFLLWQGAYAELVFIETLWPDFGRAELETALRDFHRRDRRFGGAR
ncbi:isoprenyl transferase [Magnetospirillum molischianum]|uniref:Isoprenyl transferase n=1 Tax=Magnetospirillum molischianum DSM 120 TaxID=1150626 RepID=H8FRA9_MAGML|nr:isoprenyl transferase [Magnetospirillum molischianum]CCG40897.1 Undecaprenyl pyrophosphate synthetase 2 (UPP synthetase 2) (Di-trans,poly-cis-decaprenylcistransferase 2) (Undecaprenyl diphosphate synthase 2) (UDS 2) [Magnetospirillum molischianum DSM 120]